MGRRGGGLKQVSTATDIDVLMEALRPVAVLVGFGGHAPVVRDDILWVSIVAFGKGQVRDYHTIAGAWRAVEGGHAPDRC